MVPDRCTNDLKIWIPCLGLSHNHRIVIICNKIIVFSATEHIMEIVLLIGQGHFTSVRPRNTHRLKVTDRYILSS